MSVIGEMKDEKIWALQKRIKEMANEIKDTYQDEEVVFVSVLPDVPVPDNVPLVPQSI